MVLMVLLWISLQLKSCTSMLEQMKEDVMKIQQQTPWKRLAKFRKDLEHIERFQVELNALVSIIMLIYIKHSFI